MRHRHYLRRCAPHLARFGELALIRGIVVNDRMQTSDPDIYADAACAQVNGRLYGLVGPGYLQAETAAAVIAGTPARFAAVAPATKLKVIGAAVFSVGEIEQLEVRKYVRSHVWEDGVAYRRILVGTGRLTGTTAVGDWAQSSRVPDAVQASATVHPWMLFRFRRTGALWPDAEVAPADEPDSATLCKPASRSGRCGGRWPVTPGVWRRSASAPGLAPCAAAVARSSPR